MKAKFNTLELTHAQCTFMCQISSRTVYSVALWRRKTPILHFLDDRLQNGSPYAIGRLSCLSVCLSVLSVTFVHCDQTVVRIKMKLGMQVGLGPGHIALDGDPAPLAQRGTAPPPIFSPYPLRPNGCIDQDAT